MTSVTPVSMRFSHGLPLQVVDERRAPPSLPIANGFWTHEPSSSPLRIAATKAWLASKPTNLTLPAQPGVLEREQHADRRGLVRREDAVDVLAEAVQQVLGGASSPCRASAPAYWSCDETISMPGYLAFMRSRKPFSRSSCWPSPPGSAAAGPSPCRSGAWPSASAAELRRPCSCPWRRSSRSLRGERRVDDHGRDARAARPPRPAARAPCRRAARARCRRRPGSTNPSTTCTCCSRSSSRSGPFQMISTGALRGELALRADRAGVDALPELVGRALRDHGDPVRPLLRAARALALAARRQRRERDERNERREPNEDPRGRSAGACRKAAQSHRGWPSDGNAGHAIRRAVACQLRKARQAICSFRIRARSVWGLTLQQARRAVRPLHAAKRRGRAASMWRRTDDVQRLDRARRMRPRPARARRRRRRPRRSRRAQCRRNLQRLPLADQHRAIHDCRHLADVARPVVRGEQAHVLIGTRHGPQAEAVGGALREVLGEGADVARPVAQRRNHDREHREPVIEVLAESCATRPSPADRGASRRRCVR